MRCSVVVKAMSMKCGVQLHKKHFVHIWVGGNSYSLLHHLFSSTQGAHGIIGRSQEDGNGKVSLHPPCLWHL